MMQIEKHICGICGNDINVPDTLRRWFFKQGIFEVGIPPGETYVGSAMPAIEACSDCCYWADKAICKAYPDGGRQSVADLIIKGGL